MNAFLTERGVGIVGVILMLAVLSLFGGLIVSFIATGHVVRTHSLVREQAFYNVQAGIEYALKRIEEGRNPDGERKPLAGGNLYIRYNANAGIGEITADVPSFFGSSSQTYRVSLPSQISMADCLEIDPSSARLTDNGLVLRGVRLINRCQSSLIIDIMSIVWFPHSSARMQSIFIDNQRIYSNVRGVPNETPVDIINWTMGNCAESVLTAIRFNVDMSQNNFAIIFTMTDGSRKKAHVQMVVDNEASCLGIDPSQAFVGGTGFQDLRGVVLSNLCSAPTSIAIEKMTIAWDPSIPSRRIQQIRIQESNVWNGNTGNGSTLDIQDVLLQGGAQVNQNHLRFDGDMRGRNYFVRYHMRDGTVREEKYHLYELNMARCLRVDTSHSVVWNRNNRRSDVEEGLWLNTCSGRILVDEIETTWTPLSPMSRLLEIRIDNRTLWQGSSSSGQNLNIQDLEMPGKSEMKVNRYRFNNKMNGRCLSHHISMWDGTSLVVPSYCPIASN